MKSKIYLTKHSQIRFDERTNYNSTLRQQNAIKAFKCGYEFSKFKSPLADFLKSICYDSGKYVAKIYADYIYIFNNANGHRLLTLYKVPEEYLPIEQYLIPVESLGRCMIRLTDKQTGKLFYWHEFGGLTEDIAEALEFTNQIKATNYLNNNYELEQYSNFYKIELF